MYERKIIILAKDMHKNKMATHEQVSTYLSFHIFFSQLVKKKKNFETEIKAISYSLMTILNVNSWPL